MAYKKEKALAAVNSRSGKKLTPQVSINQVTIRLLATVPSDLARHTLCRAQERKVFVMLQLPSCQLPEEAYHSVIETLQFANYRECPRSITVYIVAQYNMTLKEYIELSSWQNGAPSLQSGKFMTC